MRSSRRPRVEGERFHYFDTGIKRLIIELELDDLCVFLVHLSLKFRHRHAQLRHLFELVKRSPKPVIVAGDFNTFWGEHEMALFMEAAGLKSANREQLPSYPARRPRMELDFILHTRGIEIEAFRGAATSPSPITGRWCATSTSPARARTPR